MLDRIERDWLLVDAMCQLTDRHGFGPEAAASLVEKIIRDYLEVSDRGFGESNIQKLWRAAVQKEAAAKIEDASSGAGANRLRQLLANSSFYHSVLGTKKYLMFASRAT